MTDLQTTPSQDDRAFNIEAMVDRFEAAGHDDGRGDKRWYARDLAVLLGYTKWENFLAVLNRAKDACGQAGHTSADHFPDVRKMVPVGSGAERSIADVSLSRYAAYLTAQNADARKQPVAIAQTYFAIQTRRQEISSRQGPDFSQLSEAHQRLYLRNQVVQENKKLSGTATKAGVETAKDHAVFNHRGYQGLYGERGVAEIKQHKGLPTKAKILDHMGSTELAANLFRITQTEEKLRASGITRKIAAFEAHYEVGRKVRQTMKELSGVLPENLPVAEDVKRLAALERTIQHELPPSSQADLSGPESNGDFNPEAAAALKLPQTAISIDIRNDLWKYALLIMAVRPDGFVSTADLVAELPKYVAVEGGNGDILANRTDSRFSQLVRNLKSHKKSTTNFIYRGFAEDVVNGFRITAKGFAFVYAYFANEKPATIEDRHDQDLTCWVAREVGLDRSDLAELEWELEAVEGSGGALQGYMIVFAPDSNKRLLNKVRGLGQGYTVQVGFPPDDF